MCIGFQLPPLGDMLGAEQSETMIQLLLSIHHLHDLLEVGLEPPRRRVGVVRDGEALIHLDNE